MHTQMNRPNSFLGWVLSHWAHFDVLRLFLCMYVFWVYYRIMFWYCNMVRWTPWDWCLILKTTTSFSALTLLVGSFDPWKAVPDMIYNVFSGTLNPQSNPASRKKSLIYFCNMKYTILFRLRSDFQNAIWQQNSWSHVVHTCMSESDCCGCYLS